MKDTADGKASDSGYELCVPVMILQGSHALGGGLILPSLMCEHTSVSDVVLLPQLLPYACFQEEAAEHSELHFLAVC